MTSEDLLAKLLVLHSYVERELQGVVTAVRDLGVEERPTRKLYAILTQARERIQTALARQRMLLWKFSAESNPAARHANSAGGERVQLQKGGKNGLEEPAVGSIRAPKDCGTHTADTCARTSEPYQRRPQSSNNSDCDAGAKVEEELEWKRDTLVRMRYLLQRKIGHHTATEVDRAALTRDILKITQALEQVQQRQTNAVQQQKRTCTTTPSRSAEMPEEGYSCKTDAGATGIVPRSISGKSTCRDESARESAYSTASSGGTTSRCGSVVRERQESEIATENVSSAQSVQNVDLRLPE